MLLSHYYSLFFICLFVLFVYFKVYEGVSLMQGSLKIVILLCTVPFCIFVYLNNKCKFNKLMEINVFELSTRYL